MRLATFICLIVLLFFSLTDGVIAGGDADSTAAESASDWHFFATDSLGNNVLFRHLEKSEIVYVFYGLFLLVIAFIVLMYLKRPLQRFGERPTVVGRFLRKTTPVFLTLSWLMLIYLLIGFFIDPDSPFSIALMLITGLGILIASRDVLQDLFAGIILPFEPYLNEGKKIKIGDTFGEISRTGFRKIQIRLPDQSITVIPNRLFLRTQIDQIYESDNHVPVSVKMIIPLSSDLDQIRKVAYTAAMVSPYLFLDKPVSVYFSSELKSGSPCIRMQVDAFLLAIAYQQVFASDICEKVMKHLSSEHS